MTEKEKIPYPTEEEILQQIEYIVAQGLPQRKSFLEQLLTLQRQLGWRNLLPNRNEYIFTVIVVLSIFLFVWLTLSTQNKLTSSYFALLFMLSPFIFSSLSLYSFYDKQENQTYELEMTTKYTVFQLIGIRMLLFSSLAILCNASFSFWLSQTLNVSFFFLWLLSLTGLFLFAIGLLYVMKSGLVIRRMVIYFFGWIVGNSLLMIFADMYYIQVLMQLPIIVYAILVIVLIWLFCSEFKQLYLRKQEGIELC